MLLKISRNFKKIDRELSTNEGKISSYCLLIKLTLLPKTMIALVDLKPKQRGPWGGVITLSRVSIIEDSRDYVRSW